jgi:DNA-binding transcriptional ArsR family regulator
MTASVHERDAQQIADLLLETVDSERDLAQRARLLGLLRRGLAERLDESLFRLCHDLSVSGWTHAEIADAVSLSRPTVSAWLARYRDQHGIPRIKRDEREEQLLRAIELRAGYKG